jgi:hypothetical protein
MTWPAVVVEVTGAVVPLGAVGTTGVGLDHEIGVAVADEEPDSDLVEEDGEEAAVVDVGEPDVDGEPGDLAVEPTTSVDGAPVVEADPEPSEPAGPASCPDVGRAFDASCEGFDEPPAERTRPITKATTARPPTTAALRHLARRDRRIGWLSPLDSIGKLSFPN